MKVKVKVRVRVSARARGRARVGDRGKARGRVRVGARIGGRGVLSSSCPCLLLPCLALPCLALPCVFCLSLVAVLLPLSDLCLIFVLFFFVVYTPQLETKASESIFDMSKLVLQENFWNEKDQA